MKLAILGLIGMAAAVSCQADTIVLDNTNLTPTSLGRFLTASTWEAVGLTIGPAAVTFSSLVGYFANHNSSEGLQTDNDQTLSGDIQIPPTIDGGIFSNSAGLPGTELTGASFTPVTISATTPTLETLTTSSSITLNASTTYWFVVSDIANGFTWDQASGGTAPTAASGYTFISTQVSTNSGASWLLNGQNPLVQVNIQSSSSSTPEPSTWALAGIGGLLLFAARRRKTA
jgi:hypothetical protein